ncbi:cobalamin biosynthesis protein [Novosphingobium sp. JCM 18896]|uniref:cobalamin biosynthesis protein n=1 Tax=Novosphingobium sp. JCM 18896 TaxID=2989731 RepID=UPI002221626C|nr:cobalamin biosynthesis protein [Novosphingobium sp. JCM 18896]MCW1431228.1 cobalamin biosynthesis protein [Novosphingobium sp. JCM 18896]
MERDAVIVAGFGFRQGTALPELRAALDLAQADLPAVEALATPRDKAAGLAPLAQTLGLPLITVDEAALETQQTITQSSASLAARRTGSVAEAAALAAAGPGARLLGPRHVSPDRMATCAIAQGTPS